MDNFFKNKLAQAVLVFLAVLGIVYIYQSLTYVAYGPGAMHQEMDEHMDEMEEHMGEIHDHMDHEHEEDYAGTHIMQNGDVMTGSGQIIDGAIILTNGDVALPDGTLLKSVMDMRN